MHIIHGMLFQGWTKTTSQNSMDNSTLIMLFTLKKTKPGLLLQCIQIQPVSRKAFVQLIVTLFTLSIYSSVHNQLCERFSERQAVAGMYQVSYHPFPQEKKYFKEESVRKYQAKMIIFSNTLLEQLL